MTGVSGAPRWRWRLTTSSLAIKNVMAPVVPVRELTAVRVRCDLCAHSGVASLCSVRHMFRPTRYYTHCASCCGDNSIAESTARRRLGERKPEADLNDLSRDHRRGRRFRRV